MPNASDRFPDRRGAPLERAESYNDRRTGLVEPPHEQRRRRSLERSVQVITPAPDVAAFAGAHDHSGVYSPVGHTHTSGSITDFTEAAQDVIGALLVDSATVDYTYNDAGNAETIAVIADSSVQKTDVRKNSAGTVFSRRRLNFVEGSNITLTVADDSTDNEVDVTIAGGGGSVLVVGKQSLAGVGAVNFDNIYTSPDDVYVVEARWDGAQTTAGQIFLQYRLAGSTIATSVYYYNAIVAETSTARAYSIAAGNTYLLHDTLMYIGGPVPGYCRIILSGLGRAAQKFILWDLGATATGGVRYKSNGEGVFTTATAYDGIRFGMTLGTFTGGMVNVYRQIEA